MVQYAFASSSVCKKFSIFVNNNKDTLVIHFKGEICIRGYQWYIARYDHQTLPKSYPHYQTELHFLNSNKPTVN